MKEPLLKILRKLINWIDLDPDDPPIVLIVATEDNKPAARELAATLRWYGFHAWAEIDDLQEANLLPYGQVQAALILLPYDCTPEAIAVWESMNPLNEANKPSWTHFGPEGNEPMDADSLPLPEIIHWLLSVV